MITARIISLNVPTATIVSVNGVVSRIVTLNTSSATVKSS